MKKILLGFLLFLNFAAFAQNDFIQTVGDITTQNLNPLTGVPTAGSFVRLLLTNQSTAAITISGTYTGVLSIQLSTDGGVTYQTFTNTLLLTSEFNAAKSGTIASTSVGTFTMDCSALSEIRVSALAAVTGTASVKIKAVTGAQQIGFSEMIPAGINLIGKVGIDQTTPGTTNAVSVTNASIPVTNTGTFAVQSTATLQAGSAIAGKFGIDQTTQGTTNLVTLGANQSVNTAQIAGAATLAGNGVTGTGSQRVTIASDNTANSNPWLVAGKDANSAATTVNPVLAGARISPTTVATLDATLATGDASHLQNTTGNQLVTKDFSTSELDYTFHNTSVATTVTVQQIVPASGTASIRNFITGLTLQSDALGAAGNIWVLDGQGAIGTSVTIATPGVFTSTAHDLRVGDAIVFTSLGTITGITTNTIYYITATSFAATTFTVANTQGGTAVAITGSTSAFTFYRLLYPIRVQTAAIGSPALVTFPTPLKGFANTAINLLIPTSLTSGNIYLTVNGYRGF